MSPLKPANASPQQISDADVDDDKAGEYQGNGKPGFVVSGPGAGCALDGLALSGWAFERGNVSPSSDPCARAGRSGGAPAPPISGVIVPGKSD